MVLLGLITESEAVRISANRAHRRHHSDYQYLQADPKAAPAKAPAAKAAPAKAAPATEEVKAVKSKIIKGAHFPMNEAEADEEANKARQPLWHHSVKYSDQLANGDEVDDKELEDEDDPRDIIVDDDGFVDQWRHNPAKLAEWARAHRMTEAAANKALAQKSKQQNAQQQQKTQLQSLAQSAVQTKSQAIVETQAKVETAAEAFRPTWERTVKYSDQLANGDLDDDKEIEDEDDPDDPIADDDGFVNQFKISPAKLGDYQWRAKMLRKWDKTNQNDSLVQADDDDGEDYSKPGTKPFAKTWGPGVKYSDQLANGDAADDKELEDEDDPQDAIVDDDGFVNQFKLDKNKVGEWGWRQRLVQADSTEDFGDLAKPGSKPVANLWERKVKYSDQLANGDDADDKEVEDEDDIDDAIADDDGFVNQYKLDGKKLSDWEWTKGGKKVPRVKKAAPAQKAAPAKKTAKAVKKAAKALAQADGDDDEDYSKPGTLPLAETWGPTTPYSNQVANGDDADDKEIEDEDDPADPIVDDDGFVNQFKMNKGSTQEWGRRQNLADGDDNEDYSKPGTVPLAETWGPTVPYSNQLANGDNADNKEIEDEDDLADPIADDNGFVNQMKINQDDAQEWGRRENVNQNLADEDGNEDYSKPGTEPLANTWGAEVAESNQLANGDKADDKEIEDEDDIADPIADDNGFVNQHKMNQDSVQEWDRRPNVNQNLADQDSRWEATMGDEVDADDEQSESDDNDEELIQLDMEMMNPKNAKNPEKKEEADSNGDAPAKDPNAKETREAEVDAATPPASAKVAEEAKAPVKAEAPEAAAEPKAAADPAKAEEASAETPEAAPAKAEDAVEAPQAPEDKAAKEKDSADAKAAGEEANKASKLEAAGSNKKAKAKKPTGDDEDLSKPGSQDFEDLWGPEDRYQDQLANGDNDDDRQLEDEDDPDDAIVDDDGFVNQMKVKQANIEEWGRRPQVYEYAQLGENRHSKFSDELADGNQDDDTQIEDDNADDLANEQYVQLEDEMEGYGHSQPSPSWKSIQSLVAEQKQFDSLY